MEGWYGSVRGMCNAFRITHRDEIAVESGMHPINADCRASGLQQCLGVSDCPRDNFRCTGGQMARNHVAVATISEPKKLIS